MCTFLYLHSINLHFNVLIAEAREDVKLLFSALGIVSNYVSEHAVFPHNMYSRVSSFLSLLSLNLSLAQMKKSQQWYGFLYIIPSLDIVITGQVFHSLGYLTDV